MARRSRDWTDGLAHDLRDREFAREFLLAQATLNRLLKPFRLKLSLARLEDPQGHRAA